MSDKEFLELIKDTYDQMMDEFITESDKTKFDHILLETSQDLLATKNSSYEVIFNRVIENYLKSVKAIAKLSPGLATGLYDRKSGIIINTYNGNVSDIVDSSLIDEKTVFDVASITKMFAAILLLKEQERGNIDLNKTFADYSKLLKDIDIPIVHALRFGADIKTPGRLDDNNITNEERIKRLFGTTIVDKNSYIYNDIPYMLIPFLFGNTPEEATENYLNKFYSFYRDELSLNNTGYSTINMTGGIINTEYDKKNNRFKYKQAGLYDPKARIFSKDLGVVPTHAGVTTTIEDMQKLFDHLSEGLLSRKSLEIMTTTVSPNIYYLFDKDGNKIKKNGKIVKINHGLGVYINAHDIAISDVDPRHSNNAFAALGSTGTYSLFDIDNGINISFFSNNKSTIYSKLIDTENYEYMGSTSAIPKNFKTTVLFGTKSMQDGKILNKDGLAIPYVRSTNNFKQQSLDTVLKLRLAKRVLILKKEIENENKDKNENKTTKILKI